MCICEGRGWGGWGGADEKMKASGAWGGSGGPACCEATLAGCDICSLSPGWGNQSLDCGEGGGSCGGGMGLPLVMS